jgi:hypothetical protein
VNLEGMELELNDETEALELYEKPAAEGGVWGRIARWTTERCMNGAVASVSVAAPYCSLSLVAVMSPNCTHGDAEHATDRPVRVFVWLCNHGVAD